jgi:hypothetical protein
MGNMVKKEEYGTDKHILIANNSYMVTLPAVIDTTGVAPGVDGTARVKAGTPLYGNIRKRDTAFKIHALEGKPSCILLHDVIIENGQVTANATIVLAGVVDLLKLDADVVEEIDDVESDLPRIIFVEGSAI